MHAHGKCKHLVSVAFALALSAAALPARADSGAAAIEAGGRTFMRLLARTYTEPNAFVRQFLAEEYAEVMDRFLSALFRALPEVPRAEILWRFHFMIGAMAFAIAGLGGLSELFEATPEDDDPARLLPRLMSFLLGGLRAPLPESDVAG